VDGEINRALQKEAKIMKERGRKVLALIPLNLDGFLLSADYRSGMKAEITSRACIEHFSGLLPDRPPGIVDLAQIEGVAFGSWLLAKRPLSTID
jgi:hypothetical protein